MSETAECKGTKQNAGKYDNSRTSHLLLQNLVNSIHPETPGQIPRPARFPFGKKAFFAMARTVWRPVISGLPSAAPKGARKSRVCAEAYLCTASGRRQVRDSVEIDPAFAAA